MENNIHQHIKKHRVLKLSVAITTCVVGVLLIATIVAQMLYSSDRLLPNVVVEGVDVGSWQKKDAIWELDQRYKDQAVAIYFGDNTTPTTKAALADTGTTVGNSERIQQYEYPWYMRLVPSSLLWYGKLHPIVDKPVVVHDARVAQQYIEQAIGEDCVVPAKDATLVVKDAKLDVVPAQDGGTCDTEEALRLLLALQPEQPVQQKIVVPMVSVAPKVLDDAVQPVADTINAQLQKGVTVEYSKGSVTFDAATVATWLDVAPTADKKSVSVVVSPKKAEKALQEKIGKKVNVSAGTAQVETHDFTITKQTEGRMGYLLDVTKTASNITEYLNNRRSKAGTAIRTVQASVQYTRIYSKSSTGLSALMQHYAEEHAGVYGVQMIEIGGKGRRASYNAGKQFTTASTYKLFVAYSTLKKVESGQFKWTDQITGGRDLAACFDDMIVKSDNPCAEELTRKVTRATIDDDARKLGLTGTTAQAFGNPSPWKSTPSDEATLLAALQTGNMPLSSSSRSRWISAMKRNVYRQGIPSGVNVAVADKVGFLWALLHDAAIVYSPKGTYVLVIMTDGSSWSNIAELTRKIENLR